MKSFVEFVIIIISLALSRAPSGNGCATNCSGLPLKCYNVCGSPICSLYLDCKLTKDYAWCSVTPASEFDELAQACVPTSTTCSNSISPYELNTAGPHGNGWPMTFNQWTQDLSQPPAISKISSSGNMTSTKASTVTSHSAGKTTLKPLIPASESIGNQSTTSLSSFVWTSQSSLLASISQPTASPQGPESAGVVGWYLNSIPSVPANVSLDGVVHVLACVRLCLVEWSSECEAVALVNDRPPVNVQCFLYFAGWSSRPMVDDHSMTTYYVVKR